MIERVILKKPCFSVLLLLKFFTIHTKSYNFILSFKQSGKGEPVAVISQLHKLKILNHPLTIDHHYFLTQS